MRSQPPLRPLRLPVAVLVAGLALGLLAPVLGACAAAGQAGPASPVEHVGPVEHVVQPGETLWGLAERLRPGEDPRRFVHEVMRSNRLAGGRIFPGQTLLLPPP